MKIGVITAIDRDTSTVQALMHPILGDEQDPALPIVSGFQGYPPVPLCDAMFTDDLRYCLGTLAAPYPVIHDDFTAITATATAISGDTDWDLVIAGTGNAAGTVVDGGLGVLRVRAAAVSGAVTRVTKSVSTLSLSAAPAFWVVARVQLAPGLTGQKAHVGMVNPSTLAAPIEFGFDSLVDTTWRLIVNNIGTSTGVPVAASQWFWFDMLLVPDGYGAGWVNGQGPYFNSGAVPASSLQTGMWIDCETSAAVTRDFLIDSYDLWAVGSTPATRGMLLI